MNIIPDMHTTLTCRNDAEIIYPNIVPDMDF